LQSFAHVRFASLRLDVCEVPYRVASHSLKSAMCRGDLGLSFVHGMALRL
jgi:hypothetical protein